MSLAIKEFSPTEPQLSAITDWQPKSGSTDPSPLMPSLSPYPPTGDFCLANHPVLERRIVAKKMLDFGADSGMRDQMADGSVDEEDYEKHTLGADTIGQTSPIKFEMTPPKPTISTPSTYASPQIRLNTPLVKTVTQSNPLEALSAPLQQANLSPPEALKRSQLDTPDEPPDKRLRPGSHLDNISVEVPSSAENFHKDQVDETKKVFKVPPESDLLSSPFTVCVKLEADDDNPNISFGVHTAAPDPQGPAEDRETVTRDTENILLCHGINIFDNPEHRQDLIRFCEQSLQSFPNECTISTNGTSTGDDNSNNNNQYGSMYIHNPTAHAQLESIVKRARARGYSVWDAVYFDGQQYVPIKVASNGRDKFRLLLPMDHPHRKGVAEEIPIFKMYEIDCSPDVEEDRDEEEEENSQTSEVEEKSE